MIILPGHLIDRLLDFFNQISVVYYSTHGFLKHIFARLHRNHKQGFHYSYRVTTTVKESYYSYMVSSRHRHATWQLGATLFKSVSYQVCKSHVAASTHHDTWGLMQAGFQIITLSTRPCYLKEMSWPFYNFLKSQVAAGMRPGTWGLQYSVVEADYKVQIERPGPSHADDPALGGLHL